METRIIPLEKLEAHPSNSNVMPAQLLEKLVGQIGRSDRYPPVIVRPLGAEGRYQILDGHHRVEALRRLGRDTARCDVWAVDDAEALVLMATLNRLQGRDDPRKRASLVAELRACFDLESLALRLPEDVEGLERLRVLHQPPPPRPPAPLEQMPTAVHFFLLPEQRRQLHQCLSRIGGSREAALMEMVRQCSSRQDAQ